MAEIGILAVRGSTDFLIDAGRGDALGSKDVQLGRIFSSLSGELGPALPVASIAARGYWDDVFGVASETLDSVRARVAPLL